MRPMSRPYALLSLLCSCSMAPGATQLPASKVDLLDPVESFLQEPLSTAQLATFRKITVAQYFIALLHQTTDEEFNINQKTIGSAHSALLGAAPAFAALQEQYGSLGALLQAQDSATTLPTASELLDDVSGLASAYQTKSAMFSATPASSLATALSAQNRLAIAQPNQGLRNLGALELIAGLENAQSSALGLVGTGLPTRCGAPFGTSRATVYHYNNPPENSKVAQVIRKFGHVSVGVEVAGPDPSNDFISFNGRPDLADEDSVFGERTTIEMPPMTDKQVAQWQAYRNSNTYTQRMDASTYNAFNNNCANAVVDVLQNAGYNIPIDAQSWILTPNGLKWTLQNSQSGSDKSQ